MPRLSHATAVAYAALFIALGGSAYAIGSGSAPATGVVAACYAKQSGNLRVLLGGRCHHGERKLVWNKQGEPGPQGPQGVPGSQGPQGIQGIQGPAGTVDTSTFYTKTQSDSRYLAATGTAADSAKLGGQPPAAYAPASLFGSGVTSPVATTGGAPCVLGEVELMANIADLPPQWLPADGRVMPVNQNGALATVIGFTYGGNGTSTFALPNLQAADPKGTGPAAPEYVICVSGTFP